MTASPSGPAWLFRDWQVAAPRAWRDVVVAWPTNAQEAAARAAAGAAAEPTPGRAAAYRDAFVSEWERLADLGDPRPNVDDARAIDWELTRRARARWARIESAKRNLGDTRGARDAAEWVASLQQTMDKIAAHARQEG